MQVKGLLVFAFVCWVTSQSEVLARKLELRSGGEGWGYGEAGVLGPADWYRSYKGCAGKKQSPIDFDNPRKLRIKFSLRLGGENEVLGTLKNNGHSPTFSVDKSAGTLTIMKGRYQLEQLHFHFGCNDDEGSEHTVSGVAYPAEVHLVFFDTRYSTIQEAQDKMNGLLVVGAFLDVEDEIARQLRDETEEFPELEKITSQLYRVTEADTDVLVETPIDLSKLIPPLKNEDVTLYMYPGSLTTPPCYESVKWMVLKETVSITSEQLNAFRQLKTKRGGKMCGNFRPTQPLYGRRVFQLEF